MTPSRCAALIYGGTGLVVLGVLLWPCHAYAWGPLAHIEFAQTALEDMGGVPQLVRLLLAKCTSEYLYGALAADIIVGKNLAPYATHAHNWKVGFRVLSQSQGDSERAFAYGYLAHLAVDTVAHNYYVPYKTVLSYGRRRTGHAYWELRYDQQLDKELWRVARRITRRVHRVHDHFLKSALVGAYVLPFGISKRFYETLLISARLKKWQRLSQLVAAERELPIAPDEVAEMKALAVRQVRDLLTHGEAAACTEADPTGLRNLRLAHDLRKRLEAAEVRGYEMGSETMAEIRIAFRAAIAGPLRLPAMAAIYT